MELLQEIDHPQAGKSLAFKRPDGKMGVIPLEKYGREKAIQIIRDEWKITPDMNPTISPFGFGDEVGAAGDFVGDLITGGDASYDKSLGRVRMAQALAALESPKTETARTIASALVAGAPAQGATAAQGVLGNVAIGAGFGAVEGYGQSEGDVFENAVDTLTGAGIGGLAGLVVPGLARGAKSIINAARRVMGNPNATTAAKRNTAKSVIRALERDGVTPDKALARMKTMGDESMVLDAGGPNVLGQARAVQSSPGPGKAVIENRLYSRANNQPTRVMGAVRGSIGGDDASLAFDEIVQRRKLTADPLYDALRQQRVAIDDLPDNVASDLIDIADRKVIKSAYAQAREIADIDGVKLPENLDDALEGEMSFQTWDYIKRGLDALIYGAKRNGQYVDAATQKATSVDKAMMNSLSDLRTRLTSTLDDVFDGYARARGVYAGETRLIEALDLGKRFAKNDPDLTSRALKKMSESEKLAFREGVAESLQDIVENVQDGGDIVRRIFGKKALRDRIRLAFDSDTAFRKFAAEMTKISRQNRSKNFITGGSPTARIQNETKSLLGDLADFGIDILTEGPSGALRSLGRRAAGGVGTMGESESRALADLLVSGRASAQQQFGEAARMAAVERAIAAAGGKVAPQSAAAGGLLFNDMFEDE